MNPVVWEVARLGGHRRIEIRCTLFWNGKWGQESAGKGCVEKKTRQMLQCKSKVGDVITVKGHHTIENGRGSRRPTSQHDQIVMNVHIERVHTRLRCRGTY